MWSLFTVLQLWFLFLENFFTVFNYSLFVLTESEECPVSKADYQKDKCTKESWKPKGHFTVWKLCISCWGTGLQVTCWLRKDTIKDKKSNGEAFLLSISHCWKDRSKDGTHGAGLRREYQQRCSEYFWSLQCEVYTTC